jgi:hypothetical protein
MLRTGFNELYTYLKGKSVALVGGYLPSIEHSELKEFDVICSAHNHAQRAGYQPHIIVAGWDAPELTPNTEVCVVNIANPQAHETLKACAIGGQLVITYDSFTYRYTNPHGPEFEWSNVFSKELNTTPFTGIVALKLLSMMPVAHVFVTGFTFYARDPREFPFLVPPHHVHPQVEWLKRLIECDSRITIDSTLRHLLPVTPKQHKHTETVLVDGVHWCK